MCNTPCECRVVDRATQLKLLKIIIRAKVKSLTLDPTKTQDVTLLDVGEFATLAQLIGSHLEIRTLVDDIVVEEPALRKDHWALVLRSHSWNSSDDGGTDFHLVLQCQVPVPV